MTIFGAAGYAIAGALYLALTALLLAGWRGHRIGIFLVVASVISGAWGILTAINMTVVAMNPGLLVMIEVSRLSAWVMLLVVLVAELGVNRYLRITACIVCAIVLIAVLTIWVRNSWFGLTESYGLIALPGSLVIAAIGLILIEQLYRNSPDDVRRQLGPLVLGLGGIFVYDLFLHSQGTLLNVIDSTTWFARGAVNALFVPIIAVAAQRNYEWQLKIFVSRQVVFYSTTLLAVGIYLVAMGIGGYYIFKLGESFGAVIRTVFFAGAVTALIAIVSSIPLRSRLRVFLNKHFFRNQYDYREEWLRLTATLAASEEGSTRESVISAIAQIVGSPSGALWICDDNDSKFLLAATHQNKQKFPDLDNDDPIVEFIRASAWLVDLDEYKREPKIYKNLALPEWISNATGAWLIVPLNLRQQLLGLILLDRAPGAQQLNYEDRDLLKIVGNHIAVHLAQERLNVLLAQAQQFETYNKLTAFLMHDLNNLVAQQSLIVANAEKHKRNPEFVDDAIQTIEGSVTRMKQIMAQLKRRDTDNSATPTELKFIVSSAVDRCAGKTPAPALILNGVDVTVNTKSEEFIMVLTHLIRNAQDATSEDGNVTVTLNKERDHVEIRIEDSGVGMSDEFIRDRLFRPFDSTKGSQGMGIGAHQAREFTRELHGDIKVTSVESRGTTVSIILPLEA